MNLLSTDESELLAEADSTRRSPSVWIVVAAYNEAPRLAQALRGLREYPGTVVVVDDGSRDNTFDIALQEDVWVLRHLVNCGQGAALQTGIDFALANGADIVVTFDGDGQHSANDVPRLVAPIVSGQCEVALGSRFLDSNTRMPWRRRMVLKMAVLFTRVVSRVKVSDTHNGLRAFSRSAAQRLRIRENRMAHASEILHKIKSLGLTFCEVPVRISYSAETLAKGQSGWNAVSIASQFLLGRIVQ
jgi:glycosyltransferase involved in cell wall biosynthesis